MITLAPPTRMLRRFLVLLLFFAVCGNLPGGRASLAAEKKGGKKKDGIRLFDGKTLKGWKVTEFGGEGDVSVKDGKLMLGFGQNLTGVTWAGRKGEKFELPKENYELRLEAMRVDGSDFFCGLTFPVGDGFASLILGGWGGGVIGISSIDGMDASENETTAYQEFEEKRWYQVRVRVTGEVIQAWLDKKKIVDVDRKDRKFTVRIEVEPSRPLGIATWQTTGAIRNITLHKLPAGGKKDGGKHGPKK